MSQNKLKLNNDKTEIILFGSKKHLLAELNIKSLSVAGTDVSVATEPVRNLGAMFDSQLIMAPHVKSVVKKSSFHMRNIGKARRVLTEDATKTVMQSLVMSRLDYCNALLIGIQQDLIAKLQQLQNSAARIVLRTRKYEQITPVLIKLHWLPIKFRIQFKVLLLVYKALNGLAPKYIKELLVPSVINPDAIYDQKQRAFWMSLGLDSNLEIGLSPLVHRDYGMCFHNTWRTLHRVRPSRSVSKHTFSGAPIEALLTMTQTMTMCSAVQHFMNGNGAI